MKLIKKVAIMVLLLIAIRVFIGETGYVPSPSMEPTLMTGDCIWIDKTAYGARLPARWSDIPILNVFTWIEPLRIKDRAVDWGYGRLSNKRKPAINDVIVFNSSENRSTLLVKRITRLLREGDTLSLSPDNYKAYKNVLAKDGKTVYKRGSRVYVDEKADSIYVLSENCYFVEGDNTDNSNDSRAFGYISERDIVGKASHVLFSFDSAQRKFRRNRFIISVK